MKNDIMNYLRKYLKPYFPDVYDKYEKIFETFDDRDFEQLFLVENAGLRLYVDDKKIEQKNIDKFRIALGVDVEEKLKIPYLNNSTTKFPVMGFPIQIRELQQMVTKESASNADSSVRDMNNQASRESKTGILSDAEVAALAVYGKDSEPILEELLTARSDNNVAKRAMNEKLKNDLEVSLKDLPQDPKSRNSLLHLSANYICMGLATDLVDHIDELS